MRKVRFPAPDVSTPVVVFRAESYRALGVLRSLGRLGVKVYGIDSRAHAYGLRSRHCAGAVLWDFDGSPPDATVDFLKQVARRVGGRPLLLPTFDPRSLLVGDHAEELEEHCVFARPEAGAWDDPVPSTLFLRDLAWKTARAVYARLRSRVGRLGPRAPGPGSRR
jgi:hypothetical protein